jgi:hypothetical protein
MEEYLKMAGKLDAGIRSGVQHKEREAAATDALGQPITVNKTISQHIV